MPKASRSHDSSFSIYSPQEWYLRAQQLLPCLCLMLGASVEGANMSPITVTGFNRDLVIENTASGPPFSSSALEFNPGEGTAFYQSGLSGKTYGLPVSGSFTSATGDGTTFQFQPYTSSNALVLSSDTGLTSGTLTLVTPNTFSRIAILANSANATSTNTGTLTLHFNDGTSFTTNYNAFDWFFNSGFALQGVDRINISSGGTDGGPNGDPRFYQTTINLAAALGATNKPLTSLTFGKANAANSTAIYAISGLPASAVTLPAITNLAATSIQAKSATLGGQVTSTGSETPAVTLYYGTADGSNNAANWSTNISLGYQAGTFSQNVSGLSPNTLYYFTSKAVNSAGTVWASPSFPFTTPPLTQPTVTNLAASNVQGTLATLNGQILSTGGEPPTATLYYGTADGGSNPAAWAHSVALGVQIGAFAQTVTGLSPSTGYFFTCSASNSAGTTFASPSLTFTTQATNTPSAFAAVVTQHNDNSRTGMNLNETTLTTANVNSNQFGLVFTRAVDDQIYAQPLVATNVNLLSHGTHNVVIVCTVNDSVYAFDADNPSVTSAYWTRSFINPPNIVAPANTDMSAIGACGGAYQDFSGNMGIVGTPVIDPAAGTIYLVARTKENGSTFVQRLHALDITTGAERPNSPIIIAASYAGTGDGSSGGFIAFDPIRQNQRPGLALVNGIVYIAWSSHCDNGPYHGWVIGYDQTTLQFVDQFNDTPNGSNGGIWMSGQAPAADTNGNLYLSTGNGTVDTSGGQNRGESFLKLTRSGTNMTISSWFTPYNWSTLEGGDIDLGSGGLLLIPGTSFAFSGGKQGVVYLVNRDNMGGLSGSPTADTNVLQSFQVTTDEVHGGPVWWDGPTASYGYIWPSSVHLQQYTFNRGSGLFSMPVFSQSPTAAPSGQPGGLLSLSASGTNSGSGIVWAAHQLTGDANQSVRPGILHAYNAQNVTNELWNSEQISARDTVGNFAKFVPPTVANGKVYLATFSGRLNVYGLLASTNAQLSVSPASLNFGTVAVGTNGQASFVLSNTGGATLTNGAASVTAGPFTIISGTPFTLPVSGSTNLVIRFTPASAGNFTNSVTITSGNGGNSTNAVTGTGAVVPAASFSGSPTIGLKPLSVTFTDSSTGTITNRFWNFGDGNTTNTTATSFSHTYNNAGTNTVALTVTGPVGSNTLTKSSYIVVTNVPPILSVSPNSLNFGLLATGLSSTQSFQVVNSGGLTLTGSVTTTLPFTITSNAVLNISPVQTGFVQVAYSPTTAGSFSNVLVFSSNGGNSTNTVTGNAATVPVASFAGSPTNGTWPLAVTFTDSSTGTITNRFWNFGDGSTTNTSATSFTHTYGSASSNTVALTVSGAVGTNTQTRTAYIVVTNVPPLLSVSPNSLNFGLLATGQISTQSFQVVNSGGLTLTGSVTTTLPFTITSNAVLNISPGQTGFVQVAFSPNTAGSFSNVVVFSSNGGNSTNTVTGNAATVPVASFAGSPTNGTWPLAVTFTDSSTGTITNRFWNFGDGNTTNTSATSFIHAYATAGSNSVALTVTGPEGTNTQTRTAYIVVTNVPPLLSVNPTSLNFGLLGTGQSSTQSFQVVNSGGLSLTGSVATTSPFSIAGSSTLNVAPGQTSLVQVAFSPTLAGSFSNVVVFSSNGGNSTNTVTGSAATVPVAIFAGSPTNGTWPLAVTFTDSSSGTITNRFWDFGDGTTNTSATSFIHTYATAGSNTVALTVTGPEGTNTQTRTAYIIVTNVPPLLSVSPSSLAFGLLATGLSSTQSFQVVNSGGLTLTGSVTTTLPFTITSNAVLNISPGQTGFVQVAFSPTTAGSFSNVVVFSSNGGNSTNTVTGSAATVPVAIFAGSPTNGTWPLAVTFTDSSSGTITNRFWDFGDGNTTNTSTTSFIHTYATAGSNTVALTVTGPEGTNTQTRTAYIIVTNVPPLLSVSPTSLTFGLLATGLSSTQSFQVVNSGGLTLTGSVTTTLPFAIGSGSTLNVSPGQTSAVQVVFSPTSAGNFSNVVVFSSNGGNSTNTVIGSAATMPVAIFTGSPTNGTWPLSVTFTDSSSGTITNRFWDFGDGNTTNTSATSFTHTYAAAGSNTVALTVAGPEGTNTQTRTAYIIVTNVPPLLSVSPTSLTFGLLATGLSSTQSFQVVNSGGLALTGSVTTTLPFTITSNAVLNISPGQTGLVQVAFSPTTAGGFSNVVVFASNGGDSTNTVTGSAATMPVAIFTGSPTNGTWPLSVTFTDTSSGTITNRFWDFGDGNFTNTTATTFNHTYAAAGSNTVALTVAGPEGTNTQTRTAYIIVTNVPPLLSVSPSSLAFGLLATGLSSTQSFQVVNSGGLTLTGSVTTTLPFTIGSGSTLNVSPGQTSAVQVVFSPTAAGNFSNVVVFNSNGGDSTNTATGSSATGPVANFAGSPTNGAWPLAVLFTDSSTGTITNRFWDFGDGSTTNTSATSFNYTYNAAGSNTVALTVTGPLGTNTLSRPDYVVVSNPAVTLLIMLSNNSVVLNWPLGTLQSATLVTGVYTNFTGAASPYTLPASETSRFFRVLVK